jgi:alpha-N-arabinofuranosidase
MHLESGAYPFAPADNREWSERMLRALRAPADFYAVHNAYAPVILDDKWDLSKAADRDVVYMAMYAAREQVRENLDAVAGALTAAVAPGGARIAVTEFGPFFGLSEKTSFHTAYVDHTRTLGSALYVASILDLFLSDPRVFAAAYTNLIHPYYGVLLTDTPNGLVRTPTYYLYQLYRTRFETRILQSTVHSPTFDSKTVGYIRGHANIPDLLARASLSSDGSRLTAMLVNRSGTRGLATSVSLNGFSPSAVDCSILSASSASAINGPGLTETTTQGGEISPRPFTCGAGNPLSLNIPPNAIVSLVATR